MEMEIEMGTGMTAVAESNGAATAAHYGPCSTKIH
jgi:hypothetical protein